MLRFTAESHPTADGQRVILRVNDQLIGEITITDDRITTHLDDDEPTEHATVVAATESVLNEFDWSEVVAALLRG